MQNIIFGIFLIAILVVPKLVLSQIDAELKFEDSLKKQFSACWVMPAGVMLEKGMTMKVSAEYNEDGTLKPESVALLDTNNRMHCYEMLNSNPAVSSSHNHIIRQCSAVHSIIGRRGTELYNFRPSNIQFFQH